MLFVRAGVPLTIFVLMYLRRDDIFNVLHTLREYDSKVDHTAKRGSMTISSFSRRPSTVQNRPAYVAQFKRIAWLRARIDKFVPSCWWAGALQLVIRLAQTSMMVMVKSQPVQAAIASCIALFSIALHRELMPFRRPSDNSVCVWAQSLIFMWCFALVLRSSGMFSEHSDTVFGVSLAAVTVVVYSYALWLTIGEVRGSNVLTQAGAAPSSIVRTDQRPDAQSTEMAVSVEDDPGIVTNKYAAKAGLGDESADAPTLQFDADENASGGADSWSASLRGSAEGLDPPAINNERVGIGQEENTEQHLMAVIATKNAEIARLRALLGDRATVPAVWAHPAENTQNRWWS